MIQIYGPAQNPQQSAVYEDPAHQHESQHIEQVFILEKELEPQEEQAQASQG